MSMRRLFVVGGAVVALVAACATARNRSGEADAEALERAEAAAGELGRTLKTRVTQVMSTEGPVAAVSVCADEAQQLTRDAAERMDARVGRSSLRLRNPANAGPPWVTAWLNEQGERPAEVVAPVSRVEETPGGRMARVIKPIAVEAGCVVCHGPPEGIPQPVRELLDQRYPDDAAVGYGVGDLRGAVWAEVPVGGR